MGTIRTTLGTKYPKTIAIPNFDCSVEHIANGNLMLLGSVEYRNELYRQFVGFGRLTMIKHSENYDLVHVKFAHNEKSRVIVVSDNMARRQLLTCKKGWFMSVIGYAKVRKSGYVKDKEYRRELKYMFYAEAIQGWFVPTLVDIKRNNYALDTTIVEEEKESYINFIDEIKGFSGND